MKKKIYIAIKLIIAFIVSFLIVNEIKSYAAFNFGGVTFYYIYENIIIKLLYLVLGILILLYIYSIIKNVIDDKRYLKRNEAELDQIKKYSQLLKDQNKINENEKIDDLFKEKNDAELNFAPLYTKQEEIVDKKTENQINKKIKIKSEDKDKDKKASNLKTNKKEKEVTSDKSDEKKNKEAETEEKQEMLEELGLLERTSDIIENNYDKILNKTSKKTDYKYKNQPNLFPIVDDNYVYKYKIFNELEKIMEEYEFDLASVDIETYVSPKEYVQIHTAYENYLNAKNEITKKLEEETVQEIAESISTHKENKNKNTKTNNSNKKDIGVNEKYYDLDGVVLKQLVENIRKADSDESGETEFSIESSETKVQSTEEVKNAASIVLDVLIDKIKKLDEKEKQNKKLNKKSKKNVSKIKNENLKVQTEEKNSLKPDDGKLNKNAPKISLDLKIEKLESFKETLKTSDLFKKKN